MLQGTLNVHLFSHKTDTGPVLPAVDVPHGTNTRKSVKSHASLPTHLVTKSATEDAAYSRKINGVYFQMFTVKHMLI